MMIMTHRFQGSSNASKLGAGQLKSITLSEHSLEVLGAVGIRLADKGVEEGWAHQNGQASCRRSAYSAGWRR